ncbi:HAD family hydrolase [Paenibacillus sp. HB172176]|uniref:HAD family hydrolase n=1 Tax=Paenibacillus sp. HB172176 TaxID=2493690 RepID=UPI00143C0220|nr:HAD family hydrolase [Paenibacillus sp. HB172176]
MKCKALFLDFYGTLVHEDDDILPVIYEQIRAKAATACSAKEIGSYWWKAFSDRFRSSYGDKFLSQREIGIQSLAETLAHFDSSCTVEELISLQFEHWVRPGIYEDTLQFLQTLDGIPVYILSNIDTADIRAAIAYHGIQAAGILTSEDVRSYKPRPELFVEALTRYNLQASEVIHIGDSAVSDVGGAQGLGIRTVWLNRSNKSLPEGIVPDFICRNLHEVYSLIIGDAMT